jgi:hypothetical protein
MARLKGFVYVADNATGPMSGVRPDLLVRVEGRAPPWIVVAHGLESVQVGDWPGRLWKVEVIDRVTDADRRAAGWGKAPSGPHGRYIQSVAVSILEELPLSRLFGPVGGEAICAVLDHASRLEPHDVSQLALARHPDAEPLWRRWYDQWLRRQARGWRGFLERLRHGRHHQNNGTGTLHELMYKRAKHVARDSAFAYDEEDEANVLNATWQQAYSALRDAATAFGSAFLYTPEERLVLTAAWRAVIEPEPSRYHADPVNRDAFDKRA